MIQFVFLFEFPKALVRFVRLLSGEEAVSIAIRSRAKAAEEAHNSGNRPRLARLTEAVR